ncbi:MAG: hypothetical protein Q8K32_24855 [Archangium sp.]|nr:hypothetical protein [Archangium sp.]
MRLALGVLLLLAQVGWVVSAQRPAWWAPFHEHAVYSIKVEERGARLDTLQSLERYRLSKTHASAARDEAWETNSLDFVKDAIDARERRPARVELRARVNGEEQPVWTWP